MKKSYLIIVISLLFALPVLGQKFSSGIKYQGVARDLEGNVLPEKEIGIKISLIGSVDNQEILYSETHKVKTNQLGLFTLTIGAGNAETGEFENVPWSREDIWLELGVDENGGDNYLPVSSNQLLAVPYAIHALSAENLALKGTDKSGVTEGNGPGVKSNVWSTFGNLETTPEDDFLGTADSVDLIIGTNYTERMRVDAEGDVAIVNNTDIGLDLTVGRNVYLNTDMGDSSIINGSLTVKNQSPTLLSGTLTVDHATDLNTSLNVDGPTNLNSFLNVNYNSPTNLSGTLEVGGNALFKNSVLLDNATINSSDYTTGALVVAGGVGIGGNLNVKGSTAFSGDVSFGAPVTISDGTQSTTTGTGALVVVGGTGIGKNLNVGGATILSQTLNVTGATTLGSTLGVTGGTTLGGTLGVTGATTLGSTLNVTGATNLGSTLGVTGLATLGGGVQANGQVTIDAGFTSGSESNYADYALQVQGTHQGIAIRVNGGRTTAKNFISFWDQGSSNWGRIEGELASEFTQDPQYVIDQSFLATNIAITAADLVADIADNGQAVVKLTAAGTSSTACVGLGACVTAPIPSLIAESVSNLVVKIANVVSTTLSVALVSAELVSYNVMKNTFKGVTYQSGAGDYAEWLPKQNPEEVFYPGDIVGVKHGFISKNMDNPDEYMVISTNPIVLGNMPPENEEDKFEKVAFMGQVPVKIVGDIEPGDYILPARGGNGFGIGKNAEEMTMEDYSNIVGVAWSASNSEHFNFVNVAVGVNANDLTGVIAKQDDKINELEGQVANMYGILAELVPGFEEAANQMPQFANIQKPNLDHLKNDDYSFTQHHVDDIVYYQITREEIEAGFAMAEKIFIDSYNELDQDINEHPFWNKIYSEPGYKEEIFAEIERKFEKAIHYHREAHEDIEKSRN